MKNKKSLMHNSRMTGEILKGAVVVALLQNEAALKCQCNAKKQFTHNKKVGAMRLIELPHSVYLLLGLS